MSVATLQARQLTFDIFRDGAEPDELPELSTFTIAGALTSPKVERYARDVVVVQIIDPASGEMIARSEAHIRGVAFEEHRQNGQRPWIERRHKVKLGDPLEDDE